MAVFRSFKALRPAADKARAVAALPYDVVNREEARAIGEKNPFLFWRRKEFLSRMRIPAIIFMSR